MRFNAYKKRSFYENNFDQADDSKQHPLLYKFIRIQFKTHDNNKTGPY